MRLRLLSARSLSCSVNGPLWAPTSLSHPGSSSHVEQNSVFPLLFWNLSPWSPTSLQTRACRPGAPRARGSRAAAASPALCVRRSAVAPSSPSQPPTRISSHCSRKPRVLPNVSELLDQYHVSNTSVMICTTGNRSHGDEFCVYSPSRNLFTKNLAWWRNLFLIKLPVGNYYKIWWKRVTNSITYENEQVGHRVEIRYIPRALCVVHRWEAWAFSFSDGISWHNYTAFPGHKIDGEMHIFIGT